MYQYQCPNPMTRPGPPRLSRCCLSIKSLFLSSFSCNLKYLSRSCTTCTPAITGSRFPAPPIGISGGSGKARDCQHPITVSVLGNRASYSSISLTPRLGSILMFQHNSPAFFNVALADPHFSVASPTAGMPVPLFAVSPSLRRPEGWRMSIFRRSSSLTGI